MPDEKKSEAELLRERLLREKKSAFRKMPELFDECEEYCDEYIRFLNVAKTEREFVNEALKILRQEGFDELSAVSAFGKGSRVYFNNRGKSLIAAVAGKRPLSEGARIIAAHIDSPRLDLKPMPLYEQNDLGFFKTHYYGGIKKYQWAALPLAMHGVVVKKGGETVELSVGEEEGEPVFCVTDLLPHLSRKAQDTRTAREVIKGEELNILIGSRPVDDEKVKEPVKLYLMKLLNDRYGMVEEDFISAEIEFVPSLKAGYVGFDRSLIGAYAQDDRVSAFAGLKALQESEEPEYTVILVLADKEETGSDGNTGLASDMLKGFICALCGFSQTNPDMALLKTKCLSADVAAGFDPTFSEVSDPRNSAYLNFGVSVERYTGAGGKGNTSEASAEYVAEIRALLDGANIPWQSCELGRIDEGGGGTVAKYIARLGADVIDIGVPVLSMHAPFEITSRLDVYSLYRAFSAFYT
ncbi:MAG: aminopeptidase [Oscillospiraceae bacterium]|nr:aminopeptidase [Oscillospiraceae bacterium]